MRIYLDIEIDEAIDYFQQTMNPPIPYMGEIFALMAAIVWGFAVIFFKKSGETVHPIALNIFKNILAVILLIPTIWIFARDISFSAPIKDYLLLLLSGTLGIGVSDTLFFISLNMLGAELISIVSCTYSPFIVAMSVFWLNDTLTFLQIMGIVLIVMAVLGTTYQKKSGHLERRKAFWGLIWGILAMAVNAVGIVIIKPLLDRSPLLWVTETRLIGGAIFLIIVLLFHPQRKTIVSSISGARSWAYTIAGSFTGAYLSMIFWLAGMKFTQTSIAAALNQTNSIFVFILAVVFLKEKLNIRRAIGVTLAVAGALMATFG